MKKIFVLTIPLLLITIVLTIVHVIVSNMLSTAGVDLDTLQTQLTVYKKENTILREQVLADTSLNHIASVAAQMGFVDADKNVYLPEKLPMARR